MRTSGGGRTSVGGAAGHRGTCDEGYKRARDTRGREGRGGTKGKGGSRREWKMQDESERVADGAGQINRETERRRDAAGTACCNLVDSNAGYSAATMR